MAEALCYLTPDQALLGGALMLAAGLTIGVGIVASLIDWKRNP